MKISNVIALSTVFALFTTVVAFADTTINSNPFNLTNTTPGLAGSFYYADSGIHSLADAESYIGSNSPTGTFTANNINYVGGDSTPVSSWLGTDGASYKGTNTNTVGAFSLKGYVYVPTAGSYQFTLGSDDGARLDIGGQAVTNTLDGDHGYFTEAENVTFNKAGYYDLKVTYYNINYDNLNGNAALTLSSPLNLVKPVPEASTLTLALLGFAGLFIFAVRSRFTKVQSLA